MKNSDAFRLRKVRFSYGTGIAVRCESLVVPSGCVTAFVGNNGSGKTTLLKLMNDLVGPYEGKAEFFGLPAHRNVQLRRRSVYLHQHPVLFQGTVEDNLLFALGLKKIRGEEAKRKVITISEEFNLASLMQRRANRLSGGETQRVSLARAVAIGADVLLLDEPTSSMDRESGLQVRSMLAILKKLGTTIIMATHDESLVADLADGVVCFADNAAGERKLL